MREKVRFLGLDVHAETIAVAIAEPGGEVRSLGTIANRAESIPKLVKKLGPVAQLRACYEAGPTGYVLYWHRQVKNPQFAPTEISPPLRKSDQGSVLIGSPYVDTVVGKGGRRGWGPGRRATQLVPGLGRTPALRFSFSR